MCFYDFIDFHWFSIYFSAQGSHPCLCVHCFSSLCSYCTQFLRCMWECWESLLECRHLGSSPDGVKIESSFTVFRGNVWEGTQVSNEVATLNEGWSGGYQGWPGGEKHCSVVQIRFSLQLSCFNLVTSTSKFWRMIRHGNRSSFLPAKAFHRWSEVCDAFDLLSHSQTCHRRGSTAFLASLGGLIADVEGPDASLEPN